MSNPYAPPGGAAPPGGSAPPDDSPGERPPAAPPRQQAGAWTSAPRPPQPPPAPLDPERAREATRPVLTVAILMFATLIAASLPLPWQLGALGFGAAALVMGVRALTRLVGAGLGRSPLVVMLIGGLALTSLTLLGIGAGAMHWSVEMDHQRCMAGALTIQATDACTQAYQDGLTSGLPSWSSLFSPTSGG